MGARSVVQVVRRKIDELVIPRSARSHAISPDADLAARCRERLTRVNRERARSEVSVEVLERASGALIALDYKLGMPEPAADLRNEQTAGTGRRTTLLEAHRRLWLRCAIRRHRAGSKASHTGLENVAQSAGVEVARNENEVPGTRQGGQERDPHGRALAIRLRRGVPDHLQIQKAIDPLVVSLQDERDVLGTPQQADLFRSEEAETDRPGGPGVAQLGFASGRIAYSLS